MTFILKKKTMWLIFFEVQLKSYKKELHNSFEKSIVIDLKRKVKQTTTFNSVSKNGRDYSSL
jgi:hypothetical protein